MKEILQNIKERFNGAQSLEGIDENAIWSGIENTLNQEGGKKKRKKRFFFIFFFLGILGMSAFFVLNHIDNEIEQEAFVATEKKINSNTNNIENKGEGFIINQNNKTITQENELLETLVERNEGINQKNKWTQNDEAKKINNKNFTSIEIIQEEKINSELVLNDKIRSTIHSNLNTSIKNIITPKQELKEDKILIMDHSLVIFEDKEIEVEKKKILFELPMLESVFVIDDVKEKIELIHVVNQKKKTAKKNVTKQWELGVMGGINIIDQKYNSNSSFSEKLKETHQNEMSYSTGIQATLKKGKNWFVKSGIEFNENQVEFNILHVSDSTMERMSSVGLETIPAKAHRTIKWHNKYRSINVPLEIGWYKEMKKMELGISAGIGLNYMYQQKGKTINSSNEIVEIGKAKETRPYNTLFMSYRTSPFVKYRLTSKIGIVLSPSIHWNQYGHSNVYEMNTSSLQYALNAGLTIKL